MTGPGSSVGANTRNQLSVNCPEDCGTNCGDGACNGTEDCASCTTDCGPCLYCGDGVCNDAETTADCPQDCSFSCGDVFDDNEGTGYSGWTEFNFTDGGLPLYSEQGSQLEWDHGSGENEDDHLTLSNSPDHGQDVTINVDVGATDDVGRFYIYFFYQNEDNWYRLNVDDWASSKFEKRINGTTSQVGSSGSGVDIGSGNALQTWKIEVTSSGTFQFISEGSTILNVSQALGLSSGKIGLGGTGRRSVWDNFSFQSGSASADIGWVVLIDETNVGSASGSEQFWQMQVPNGAADVEIQMSAGSGDADLYVTKDGEVSRSNYDCRPHNPDNNEACSFTGGGTYSILLHGFDSFSGVALEGQYYYHAGACQ